MKGEDSFIVKHSVLDIDELVSYNDSDFGLNVKVLKEDLKTLLKNNNINGNIPVIMFLDPNDPVSRTYVKSGLNDVTGTNIDLIPIDFTVLYKNTKGSVFNINREIHCMTMNYGLDFIPYLVQEPFTTVYKNKFNSNNIREKITDIVTNEISKNYKHSPSKEAVKLTTISDIDSTTDHRSRNLVSREFKYIEHNSFTDYNTAVQAIKLAMIPASCKCTVLLVLHYFKDRSISKIKDRPNITGSSIALLGYDSRLAGIYLTELLPKMGATVTLYHSKSVINHDEFSKYDVVVSCITGTNMVTFESIGKSNNGLLIELCYSCKKGVLKNNFAEKLEIEIAPYVGCMEIITRRALLSNIVASYSKYFNLISKRR